MKSLLGFFFVIATNASKNQQITTIGGTSNDQLISIQNLFNSIFTAEPLAFYQAINDLPGKTSIFNGQLVRLQGIEKCHY